ncbi:MAG: hypothetical protein ABSC91_10020 [Candidatus Bathyarchaeia archaeon]
MTFTIWVSSYGGELIKDYLEICRSKEERWGRKMHFSLLFLKNVLLFKERKKTD